MGLYKHLDRLHKEKPEAYNKLVKDRLIGWRRETAIHRIEYPTNLISARRLGYKAKHGFILIRVRLPRGGLERPTIRKGRRSAHMRQRLVLKKSYQWVAEERAVKNYPNLEVLNSYKVAKDGLHYWFEVILVDPHHQEIKADKQISWIINQRGRVHRGLTSAGNKSRAQRGKGKGYEKARPSLRAHLSRAK